MYSRKRLDVQWKDVFADPAYLLIPRDRDHYGRAVESRFAAAGHGLATLSVRTGFDLLLGEMDWPPGSEIIMSAITIPDMPRIVRHHGLVPVPVGVDARLVVPSVDAIREAIGPKTRAIVVAHLFGTRVDLTPIAALAREHGLLLIEDCAQSYDGRPPTAPSVADVSMFSFGTIKTATAFGGAVLVMRDPGLRDAMARTQARYPVASKRKFGLKFAKYLLLMVLTLPWLYGLFARALKFIGKDHDQFIRRSTRGFSGPNFFEAIRHRPSSPLLGILDRRLRGYDPQRVLDRRACGEELAALLSPGVTYFGCDASEHI
ncbi:MAG: DegT/DnrJ/EryC1/StrS family aminotransferase, partial [Bradymonadaceae bacterium]